ncbi:MAG TPA: TrmH family RNA methyltransferase [Myxococcaceae bacterium]|nr:TrmH family RNA methyltransferase [Myxococcaceae bacterium]
MGPRAGGDPVARVRFVLMRPRNGGNLGAAARALKNFGLSDWAWVAPSPALDWSEARKRAVHPGNLDAAARRDSLAEARKRAVHAEDLLDAAVRRHSLADAVADCAWVVGTSSRAVPGRRRLSPRDAAEEALRRAASGTVAVVFGDERSGLTNAEVQRCHALSSVPTSDAQPSINLAQAVLLYAYEVRLAALAAVPPPRAPRAQPASDAELERLRGALADVLERGGFLVHPGRHAVRDLMTPLIRSAMSRREARLWMAALSRVARAFRDHG